MKLKWEIDDATVVEAKFGGFGKEVVTINGTEAHNRRSMRTKGEIPLRLPDGRAAIISVAPQFLGHPTVELLVENRLMAQTTKETTKCGACGAVAKPNDRFCDGCGKPLPTAEHRKHEKHVKEATGTMRSLAVLFSVFGVIMFFVTKAQSSNAMAKLANMDPTKTLQIGETTRTVAVLRDQLRWEPWSVLITNFVLAAVMAGLAMWGKRAPLPAVLVATATYVVVIVMNAIVDPKSIAQGFIVKIIIIAFFVKGIKAALALRAANA